MSVASYFSSTAAADDDDDDAAAAAASSFLLLLLLFLLLLLLLFMLLMLINYYYLSDYDASVTEMVISTSQLAEHEISLRKDVTDKVIRMMWKQLMGNIEHNVIVLAGYLKQKEKITHSEETTIITSQTNSRDKSAELLATVKRKGRQCLVELVNGMKELKPLRHLAKDIEQCSKLYSRSNVFC